MIGGTLSPGPEKPKFSKYSLSNQILGEGYICLVCVLYGIISSRNTPQSDVFKTQIDFMLFLRFLVQSIKALPNHVRCSPNSRILFLITPNMYIKYKIIIYNPINIILCLIFNLPINSSPWFSKKNKVFQCKTFSNLVFWRWFLFWWN